MKNKSIMPSNRVTLKDIAKDTGFSVNTVSHALKDMEDISEKTRRLIQQRASEMGYIADSVAGSMRSGRTRTIAVILGDVSNPHFGLWVREIETVVFRHGYNTLIINTDEDAEVEQSAIIAAIGKRVDGIIICPTQKQNCLGILQKSGVPFILIGRRWEETSADYVVLDDVRGGYIATRNLMERGAERILFLNGPEYISSSRERLQGYLDAHRDTGTPVDRELIRPIGIKSGECGKVLQEVISRNIDFTGILAFSDIVAFNILNELRKAGGVFSHIPIASFDDIMQGLVLPIPLDSVDSAEASPSVTAANLLLQHIREKSRNEPHLTQQIVLKVKLVHRNFF